MNIGQMQVIVNDLCNQVEIINEMLTQHLVSKDDLLVQQDSLLDTIQNLTKYI